MNVVAKMWSIDNDAGKAIVKSALWTFIFKLFDVVPDITIGLIINCAILKDQSFLSQLGFPSDVTTIIVFTAVILCAFVASNGAHYCIALELGKAATIVTYRLKMDLCQSILFSSYNREAAADKQHQKNHDIETIDFFIRRTYEEMLKIGFSSVVIGVILVCIAPQFLLYALLPVPITFYVAKVLNKKIEPHQDGVKHATKDLQRDIDELIACLPTVKDFAIEQRVLCAVEQKASFLRQTRHGSLSITSLLLPSTRIFIQIASLAIVVHGIFLVWHHEISIGALAAAIFLSRKFLQPFSSLGMVWNNYRKGTAALRDLDLRGANTNNLAVGDRRMDNCAAPSIVLSEVSFSYGNKKILHNLSFEFPAERINVIKGCTGRGKTTLCRLLTRDYAYDSGAIFYGSSTIDCFARADWKKHARIVTQYPQLFMASIHQNITLFAQEFDQARFAHALELSLMVEFVSRLPHGVDSVVGGQGVSLSLGQTQSLALARALYCDPKILVLDEPTTGFDDERELQFIRALKSIVKGRIVIITSHSQNIIKAADNLLEL